MIAIMVSLLIRIIWALLALAAAVSAPAAHADSGASGFHPTTSITRVLRTQSWIEEWDPIAERWVDSAAPWQRAGEPDASRPVPAASPPLAVFGPFVILNPTTAAVMGSTNAESPDDFVRMRAAFPYIDTLELVEAPGTVNDLANLRLGRMIRAAGISTHVPGNGSVRSGAVELFLAGKTRSMDPGAQFAVHSWRDQRGRGPHDFASDDPVNRLYLSYYEDMGMSPEDARAFYDMTNSVPHSSALWFGSEVMRGWVARQRTGQVAQIPAMSIEIAADLISRPFAPLDNVGFTPTLRFAHNPQVRLEVPEAIWAFGGT